MPPPMPNPNKRMTANPARPVARYRPGKATQREESSSEDEDEAEEKTQRQAQSRARPATQRSRAPITPQIKEDDDDEDGFVTDEDDQEEAHPAVVHSQPQISHEPKNQGRSEQVGTGSSSTDEEDSADGTSSEDEEEEESSEDEISQRKFQRPTFIKKSNRSQNLSGSTSNGIQNPSAANSTTQPSAPTGNEIGISSSLADVDEQLRRRAQADLMIQDKLERDAIARAAGKKSWDDDDDGLAPDQLVDDTDGVEPEVEHQAWKLRELKRLKRDREAIETREKEIEEQERRRNLTAEERDREDEEFVAKQRAERDEGRSQAAYLARYHHKGAFFLDDENAALLKQRDIMGARFEDDIQDKSTLPEYMQIRDMTKLGKKGRTRYTDLKGQDTGRFGEDVKRWRGAGDNRNNNDGTPRISNSGVDERFLPDSERAGPGSTVDQRSRRRNDTDTGSTEKRNRSRSPRRTKDDDHHHYSNRDRTDSYRSKRRSSYSRSRSRSKSPRYRRKRSPSPYSDRDKRRRVEA